MPAPPATPPAPRPCFCGAEAPHRGQNPARSSTVEAADFTFSWGWAIITNMNDKLENLINQASGRVQAVENARTTEQQRREAEEQERDAATFKRTVETTLGAGVLEAIGPVTFVQRFLAQAMTFHVDGRSFRLRQQTGALMQLEETENNEFSYRMLGHQFNLHNEDAKDTFLNTLGNALKKDK